MSSRKQSQRPDGGPESPPSSSTSDGASPESLVRAGFLTLCSSLGASPIDILNFLISIQGEFLPPVDPLGSPPSHQIWGCGLCGRESIHLSGATLRSMRQRKGGVGARGKDSWGVTGEERRSSEGWLTLSVMAKRVAEEIGAPVSICGLSEMERGLKRPSRGVEEAYERICGEEKAG